MLHIVHVAKNSNTMQLIDKYLSHWFHFPKETLRIAIQLLHIHLMPTRELFDETNKHYSKYQYSAAFSNLCMRFGNILSLV